MVATNQTNHAINHQQLPNNTQASVVNPGWPPQGVGSIAPQAHHAVVTDPSSLAYMTHPYPSHNSSVGDHHRNSNGPLSTQPIGNGPQASSYTVDALYNSPAAAVAAYGYNNYNAAFFQSSNNGPHGQTGNPSPANMSTFWNQSQPQAQQRNAHSQAVPNSNSAQQRQHMGSEQASNFMHDPRVFYSRPSYNQGIQNFSQTATQPQTNVLHHQMSVSQQLQILHGQDTLNQVPHSQQLSQVHQQPPINNQQHPPQGANQQTLLGQQPTSNQPSHVGSAQATTSHSHPSSRPGSNVKSSSQIEQNRQPSMDSDTVPPLGIAKRQFGGDQTSSIDTQSKSTSQVAQQSNLSKETTPTSTQNITRDSQTQRVSPGLMTQNNRSDSPNSVQEASKSGTTSQYQRKAQNNTYSQLQGRNPYKPPQEDQAIKGSERKFSSGTDQAKSQLSVRPSAALQDSVPSPSLEDSIGSLSIGPSRKTTWASIASQPAKVSQPKSLKSKIAGSNSVLSSAKHLVAISLDSSTLESKNGINPAIKSSVSAAATSMQRSSVPPPISKMPPAAANLKLDLLDAENSEPSKISWPAVNASINLTLNEPVKKEEVPAISEQNSSEKVFRKDDGYRNRDFRDAPYKDHNHNHGPSSKMVNSYQPPHGSGRDHWNNREQRDPRIRRNSDRKDVVEIDRRDDSRDSVNYRRDYKPVDRRTNQFRTDERFRERDFNKRNTTEGHASQRGNEGYQNSRFASNRFEPRESHQSRHSENQNSQHHHYNNVRDGSTAVNAKIDLKLHPHLNPANFNPQTFDLEPKDARYFIIKSYSEDDIHRSIKYSIWCSTNHGNKRLDEAYRQQQSTGGPIYLFFSVNGSGHFCGMAQMTSSVDFDSSSGVWAQSKWQGEFSVKWIYVKDVPNGALRHITLENNEDKPVTNSRDTQEALSEKGKAVLKVMHQYSHTSSLFDDFLHYERRQEEEKFKKSHVEQPINRSEDRGGARYNRPYVNHRPHNDFHNNRERPTRYAS